MSAGLRSKVAGELRELHGEFLQEPLGVKVREHTDEDGLVRSGGVGHLPIGGRDAPARRGGPGLLGCRMAGLLRCGRGFGALAGTVPRTLVRVLRCKVGRRAHCDAVARDVDGGRRAARYGCADPEDRLGRAGQDAVHHAVGILANHAAHGDPAGCGEDAQAVVHPGRVVDGRDLGEEDCLHPKGREIVPNSYDALVGEDEQALAGGELAGHHVDHGFAVLKALGQVADGRARPEGDQHPPRGLGDVCAQLHNRPNGRRRPHLRTCARERGSGAQGRAGV